MIERGIKCVGLLPSKITSSVWHVIDRLGLKTVGMYI